VKGRQKKEDFKIINDKITIFRDGRALVKAKSISEAKKVYNANR